MLQTEQITVAKQLLAYIDTQTTSMSPTVYRQPVREYICREQAARERRHFFREAPLCVGLSGMLPQPGTYFTHDLSGTALLITRALDGRVRAFLNVCRHRGAQVASACGSARGFTCPYHAWVYGLDGALISRPEELSFAGAERQTHGLTPLAAVEQDGFLWVCPTPGRGIDLRARCEGILPELAAYGVAGFHHYATRELRRRMNWKLVVDTFLESYHFAILHRNSIAPIFYQNLATFDTWGADFRLVSPRRTIEALRAQPEPEWNLLKHMVGIYVLFPNTVFVWQGEQIELWQIFPAGEDPDEAVFSVSLYSREPALTDSAKRHWDNNLKLVLHVVENEDFPVGETIQRNFHTEAQDHTVFGMNEPALAHYHRCISEVVGTRTA